MWPTEENAAFNWSSECKAVFQYFKEQLMNPEILHYPDFSKVFILHTDASDFAIGYVLSQVENKELLPIYFGGRVLAPVEKRYAHRELLAIHDSVSSQGMQDHLGAKSANWLAN